MCHISLQYACGECYLFRGSASHVDGSVLQSRPSDVQILTAWTGRMESLGFEVGRESAGHGCRALDHDSSAELQESEEDSSEEFSGSGPGFFRDLKLLDPQRGSYLTTYPIQFHVRTKPPEWGESRRRRRRRRGLHRRIRSKKTSLRSTGR